MGTTIRLGIAAVAAIVACAPAQAAPMRQYTASNGEAVWISGFPEAAPQFAEFLVTLPHGTELSSLKLLLRPPPQVPKECGAEGMTACYVVDENLIIAPGPELEPELLAHEYGHHLAAHRPSPPFDSVAFGPPRWASHQRICAGMRTGQLGRSWAEDPAEAWADVYARLMFPHLAWRLSPALQPADDAYAAAVLDVAAPSGPTSRSRRFRGRFGEFGTGRRTYRLPLRLDGTVGFQLQAQKSLRLNLSVRSGDRLVASTTARALGFTACRTHAVEWLTLEVRRRSGTGDFRLRAHYPG